MELWQKVWRQGLAPQLTDTALKVLRQALEKDDRQIVQGATVCPPALDVFEGNLVEAACALGFCGWKGEGHETVGVLSDYFTRLCAASDERLGEPGICRHFLHWFDETPR